MYATRSDSSFLIKDKRTRGPALYNRPALRPYFVATSLGPLFRRSLFPRARCLCNGVFPRAFARFAHYVSGSGDWLAEEANQCFAAEAGSFFSALRARERQQRDSRLLPSVMDSLDPFRYDTMQLLLSTVRGWPIEFWSAPLSQVDAFMYLVSLPPPYSPFLTVRFSNVVLPAAAIQTPA